MPQIKFYKYTKKWLFCNVYPSMSPTKTIFPDTNTGTNSHEQKKTSHPSFVYLCIHLFSKEFTALATSNIFKGTIKKKAVVL